MNSSSLDPISRAMFGSLMLFLNRYAHDEYLPPSNTDSC